MTSRWRLAALAVGASLLLPLALPNELTPWGNPLTGVLCIAPFLAAVSMAPSFRFASLLGAIFGALSTLLSNYWLSFFQEFSVWTLGGVVVAYTGYNALLGAVLHGLARTGSARFRPFLLAAAWAVYEYLKSTGFLGYPWGLVAYPIHDVLPLVQIADITGVWGVSLLMSGVNAVAAEGMVRLATSASRGTLPPSAEPARWEWVRQALVVALLCAAALAYGLARLAAPDDPDGRARSLTVVLAQQSTNPWEPFDTEGIIANQDLSLQALQEARSRVVAPDLVVWSETSLNYDPSTHSSYYRSYPKQRPLLPYLRTMGVPHLIGTALDVNPKAQQWMNGAALILPDGRVIETYGKQHPVPFAEAIPFWESPAVRWFFTTAVGIQMPWVMGSRSVVFGLPLRDGTFVRFGAPICFEDAFSDLCRRFVLGGADLLVNLTNDSWSQKISALTQHLVASRFRAIENRRILARSTNGGVTAIIDPRGRITRTLPSFRPGYVLATLRLEQNPETTAYTRFGDWLPLSLAALLVALLTAKVLLDRVRALRAGRERATP